MKKLITLIATGLLFPLAGSGQLSFYADNYSGCADLLINFTNTSSTGYEFDWNFGDGTSLNNMNISFNPSHVYTNTGMYTVVMDVFDGGGAYLGTEYTTITVTGPAPYISMPETACPGDMVNFWVPVNGPSYTWDYGDGVIQTTTDQYTNHAYTTPGMHYVSMTYYDPNCGQTYTTYDSIFIDSTLPYFGSYPGIYLYQPTACPNEEVQLHVNGNTYQSYSWDFGNGNFSSENYTYTSYSTLGAYTISVTLLNGCGVDTTLYENINIDNSTPAPILPIQGITEVCIGSEFFLEAYGPPGLDYSWDFGDGTPVFNSQNSYAYHTYTSGGTYNVELTIENQCGNTSTSFYTVEATTTAPVYNPYFQIYPSAVCPGDEVNFSVGNDYTFYIDYGDGTGQSGNGGSNHTYATPGDYPVYVIFENACGSTLTIYDTVHVQLGLPITNNLYLDIYPNEACPNASLYFNAPYGYSNYTWNFGDGYTSSYQQVSHPYLNAGTYSVSVTVTNGCGADTTLFDVAEVVSDLPVSELNWGVFADEICPGNDVYMAIDDENDALDVLWDFGDGTGSTDDLASHSYDTPGNYTITLTATNTCGSDSTVTHTILVGNAVVPSFSDIAMEIQSPGCIGDNLYFAVMPAGQGTYYWDFGDGEFGYSDQTVLVGDQPLQVGFHAYDAVGSYNATLTVTNACGNAVDTTLVVEIGGPGADVEADVHFFYDQTAIICQGQPITFFGVGAGTYYWDFGDGTGGLLTTGSLSPVEHLYDDYGSYIVTVVGFNACGGTGIDDNEIFIPDSEIDVLTNTVQDSDCGVNNGVAIVSATGGTQPYNYSWTNGDEGVLADSLGSGIYVVTVTDNNGCSTEALTAVSDDQGPVILLENIVHNECFGQDNGVISVSVLGGAPPYTITWSNGDVTEDIFNLEAGPYEIFVTDANGCFAAKSFDVGQPDESVVSVYSVAAACGSNNGEAAAAISNGNPPFNYIWPNTTGSSDATSGLAPGVYELMVIDGNTCLLQTTFVINETNAPIIITDSISDATCSGDLSAVYINTIGGTGPFSYDWSNGSSSEDLTNVLPGEYSVEVEGSDGCSAFMFFNLEMSAPEETSVCIVTVDTLTNSNLVVWTPVMAADVVSYNIYKESSQSGLYYLVGNQSADSISQFNDYLSNPAIRSWRYRIAPVDDCGNEGPLSDPHKTIHLTSNLGISGEVNLIWDHYNGFNYDTYYINRYHPSTGWEVIDSVASNLISYTDLTPPDDSNMVYMVTIVPPSTCTASKAQDHNSSRSNKSSINMPDSGTIDDSGVGENNTDSFAVYPNPTSGLVHVVYSDIIINVTVYDLSGQLVYQSGTNSSNSMSIDCTSFSRGVYTVQLTTAAGPVYSRIVKQ
jgi:PKD repeat protein